MPADFFFIGSKFPYNCYYYFNTWCVELEYGWIRNWNHRLMGLDPLWVLIIQIYYVHWIVILLSVLWCSYMYVCCFDGLIFLGRGTIWPSLVESLHLERHIMQQYVLVSFANCFFHNVAALYIQPHMYMFLCLMKVINLRLFSYICYSCSN